MYDHSPFAKIGTFIYRLRVVIVLLWIAATVIFGFFGSRLPDILGGSGFRIEESSSAKVEKSLINDFKLPNSTMIVVFESNTYTPDDQPYKTYVEDTLNKLKELPHAVSVESPYISEGKIKDNVAYAALGFDKEYDHLKNEISKARKLIEENSDITARLTGVPVITEDMNEASQHDLAKAEAIGLPAALIVLLIAFGGLVAAGIPLVTGGIAVLSSMGIIYFIGLQLNLSVFVLNVVPMIGFALGIDFALLLINRFREELGTHSVEQAVSRSVATAGRSIAFSGLCVLLGLAGMLFIRVEIFRTVALSGIVVVVVSVISALTFLPALLGILGSRVNSLRLFKPNENGKSVWQTFSSFVMRRPVILAIISVAILLTGLAPIKDLNLAIPESDSLPSSYDSRIAFEKLESTFGEKDLNRVQIVVESKGPVMDRENLADVYDLVEELKKESIIDNVQSIFSLTGDTTDETLYGYAQQPEAKSKISPVIDKLVKNNKTYISASLHVDTSSKKAQDWVRNWEGQHGDVNVLIGGKTKFYQEIFDDIYERAPYGLLLVMISTYIILFIAFRSVLIPLKAIIMNVLSLGATFGILVWIFQEGHFSGVMDFVPNGTIGLMIPIFIFSLVFGLSMDYEVFLISRMHEVYLETRDNDEATLKGLVSTSKIITSAAAIMIAITGSFAFTGVMPVKQMGVGIALAIFLDATLIRMILTPALMKLLGHLNWWSPKMFSEKSTSEA